jgi:hypothetical protein
VAPHRGVPLPRWSSSVVRVPGRSRRFSGNRCRRCDGPTPTISPSPCRLRPDPRVRATPAARDPPCPPSSPVRRGRRHPPPHPWGRPVPVRRHRPCHPSVRLNRSGQSLLDPPSAREVHTTLGHPFRPWAPATPAGRDRPPLPVGLPAQAGVAGRLSVGSVCATEHRVHPRDPPMTTCGARGVWRDAPAWSGGPVLFVRRFS